MPRIPKILHYCFGLAEDFGGKPWSLVHHVCLASAVARIQPDQVRFYYEYEPQGPWWRLSRPLVEPIKVAAPREVFGNPLAHPAHRADVLRLRALLEHGGIYLDADVLAHRSFDDLLEHSAVLGQEGEGGAEGLANAVILAEPGAPFLARWYEEYTSFRSLGRDEFWNEHSVQIPSRLARAAAPDELTVLGHDAFYWPMWREEGLRQLFGPSRLFGGREPDCAGAYANHLWESLAWRHLEDLNPGRVRRRGSNFDHWAAPYLEGLPDRYGADDGGLGADLWAGLAVQAKSALRWRVRQMRARAAW